MSRGAHTFKQGDVTKAVRAVVNAGVAIARVEISRDGRIIVIASSAEHGQDHATEANEWDSVT